MASSSERCSLLSLSAILTPKTISSAKAPFLEWAKNNKRSWKHDRFRVRVLLEAFRGKTLGEISPLVIERFKSQRQHSFTKYDKQRSPASVNRELELLSRIFSLAIRLGLAEFNPCSPSQQVQAAKSAA